MDVARVAETGCIRCHPGAISRVWPTSQVDYHCRAAGGRLGDRHMPGGRRPLGPANVGVTEDRG